MKARITDKRRKFLTPTKAARLKAHMEKKFHIDESPHGEKST